MSNCQPDIATHNSAGSTQTSRILHALKTDYIKVDERTIEDFIIATNTLSEHLNYYNPNNVLLGNWSSFFQWESTAVLAQISILDTNQYLTDLKLKKRTLLFEPDATIRRKIIVDFFKNIENTFKNIEDKIEHISNEIQFKEYLKATVPTIKSLLEMIVERLETPTKEADIDDVRFTLQHHLFNKKIQNLFGLLNDWKKKSSIQLQENLNSYASHTPQYALFLAFLKLFGIAQEDLNHFTKRHLDFYYKKILHLSSETAKPDYVHLCIEPNKNQIPFLVDKNSVFIAGKDKVGKNKYYKSTGDTAINHAKILNLYGAAIGNNTTYYFEDLTDKNASGDNFKAFPKVKKSKELGLAIASPLLFLRGGLRTITLTFNGMAQIDKNHYNFYLTGAKEWIQLTPEDVTGNPNAIQFIITTDEKAIIPFNSELHEGAKLNTPFPVLKINTKEGKLHETSFETITIKVNVADYKQFRLFSDVGEVDHTKSFQPFGAVPRTGNGMVFSCNEFFQKNGAIGLLNIETDKNDWFLPENTDLKFLKQGNWSSEVSGSQGSWNSLYFFRNLSKTSFSFSENLPLTEKDSEGFVKISLQNLANYGNEKYLENYITAASDKTTLPYIPTVNNITFWYEVEDTIKIGTIIGSSGNSFSSYHLYPSGYKELTTLTKTILPDIEDKGVFYIGLKNTLPGNAINLLIQVAEGTANPRQNTINLEWQYLNKNIWQSFEKGNLIEGTNNLTQSGIVQFTVPETIELSEQTQFFSNVFWIKIVAPNKNNNALDAVCDILGVHAQALKATLFDFENSGLLFTENTEAETISKLYKPKNEIKSISQPYTSFGGKIKETDALFYQRVSERLRHKDRAITIWDYEKLILDNFPEVFRVKCLNHFRYDKRESENIGEIANTGAGYVTIIPVAKAKGKETNIIWKPLVDLGTMSRIKMFLEKKASPHVRINVKTPELEKLELQFQVTYREIPGGDEIIYKQQLQDVINTYLSPWAYNNTEEVTFQSEIEKSELIQLIEKQLFVDYISDFVVKHHTLKKNSENIDLSKSKIVVNKIIPNTPYSLFIPHEHLILTNKPCCS
ncbi:baseplate J/gp47 family protein [Lutibacter citreus]|uniref:baseplate J/gp47 family protein n=1 Tax=Lutibacter citreus TaxID=2138210 RepID=UPI000DBE15A4|nr:baseplate J/gp47 family protein [Lutibacter citreus]